jgi:hypothetical protein
VDAAAVSPFAPIRNHILLPWAGEMEAADQRSSSLLNEGVFSGFLDSIPDPWLMPVPGAESPDAKRSGYLNYFLRRLKNSSRFVMEAMRARAELI